MRIREATGRAGSGCYNNQEELKVHDFKIKLSTQDGDNEIWMDGEDLLRGDRPMRVIAVEVAHEARGVPTVVLHLQAATVDLQVLDGDRELVVSGVEDLLDHLDPGVIDQRVLDNAGLGDPAGAAKYIEVIKAELRGS